MMRNESDSILDDLLSRWHSWCRGNKYQNEAAADPAFKGHRSSRQWDTLDEVIESDLTTATMECMDFVICGDKRGQGGMDEPYRSAIHVNARNCCTGREVWLSPRLPKDREERRLLVLEARNILLRRLISAGVV
mgnify:CR=1 FL=1